MPLLKHAKLNRIMLKKCNIKEKLKNIKYARNIISLFQKAMFQRYKNRRNVFLTYLISSKHLINNYFQLKKLIITTIIIYRKKFVNNIVDVC